MGLAEVLTMVLSRAARDSTLTMEQRRAGVYRLTDFNTAPASASSRHGVVSKNSRSDHSATHAYKAFASVVSTTANPRPLIPCQRPTSLTPAGGIPPASRKRPTAVWNVPWGKVQETMYFITF